MADQTSSSILIEATPDVVMAAIADFAEYPTWARGVQRADVVSDGADGRPEQVYFVLDVPPIKDQYTLSYTWEGDRRVEWHLVEGTMLRALDGEYELSAVEDGVTEVTYRLSLDLAVPLLGMLKRRGEKMLIDTALSGLKQHVESVE